MSNAPMIRPCFLVIDREFPGSISTRKLVIETAKFNVLTAYSGQEALEVFTRFPAVTGIVLDGGLDDIPCGELADKIKLLQPNVPIIVITTPGFTDVPKPTTNLNPSIQRSYSKFFAALNQTPALRSRSATKSSAARSFPSIALRKKGPFPFAILCKGEGLSYRLLISQLRRRS